MSTQIACVVGRAHSSGSAEAYLIASGDLGQSASQTCWAAECTLRAKVTALLREAGCTLRPVHPFEPEQGDAFLYNQPLGDGIFAWIPQNAPVVVADAVWHGSEDLLHGLLSHQGPILTLGNLSGDWPGLMGALSLNGSLRKAGKPFSTLISRNFEGEAFRSQLRSWWTAGEIRSNEAHVKPLHPDRLAPAAAALGHVLAGQFRTAGSTLGTVCDCCPPVDCGIIEESLLASLGVRKSTISSATLLEAVRQVSASEALRVRRWLEERGVRFMTGSCEEADLTDGQILDQCRTYIAALRLCAESPCDALGIHYEGALKHLMPAPDIAEGLMNNAERPPVFGNSGVELFRGVPVPYFNEADECAGLDALITSQIWNSLGLDSATTAHDIHALTSGEPEQQGSLWAFQLSGALPASHLIGGYAGIVSERQPTLCFPQGGGTLRGVGKTGELVWSRIFVEGNELHADLGRATAVEPSREQLQSLRHVLTPQWPLLVAEVHGATPVQFATRQRSHHLNVAYAPTAEVADHCLAVKAAMLSSLSFHVHLCGA